MTTSEVIGDWVDYPSRKLRPRHQVTARLAGQIMTTDTSQSRNEEPLSGTFVTLRKMLQQHGRHLKVMADRPGDFQLASPTHVDRIGRPLFTASVQIRKNYVSLHVVGICAPELLAAMSPGLRKRMRGKTCFNFTTIDASQLDELGALTQKGIERMERLTLPWERP